MSLLTSKVPRSLETKTKLFGFELGDLVLIFLYLALSNLVFGQTNLKLPLVWLGTLALGAVLYFTKRGKPDHHLEHLGEYLRAPGILSAGKADTKYQPYLDKSTDEENNS
jgi:hypothetical protein